MKKKLVSGFILCLCVVCFSVFFSGCKAKKNEVNLTEVVDAVKSAYGDAYVPDMVFTESEIAEILGIKKDLYEEIVAEGPRISVRTDTFIAAKAAAGKADDLEKAVIAYRDKLADNTMQYPMNLPMTKAAQVVRNGDYVFFVLLGELPQEVLETGDETKMNDAAKKQIEIGTDAINKAFGK